MGKCGFLAPGIFCEVANLICCFLAMSVQLSYEQIVPFQRNRDKIKKKKTTQESSSRLKHPKTKFKKCFCKLASSESRRPGCRETMAFSPLVSLAKVTQHDGGKKHL